MNLYKSFGNLLESWVTEEDVCSDSEWIGIKTQDSPRVSSDAGTSRCSESVDSGVEMASSDMSPALCYPGLTDGADVDAVTPDSDKPTSDSPSESPVFYVPSSSSAHRAQEESPGAHLKLEEALRRIDPKRSRSNSQADDREWSRSSLLPKRYSSVLVKGQRSDGVRERRTITELVPIRQMSSLHRRPLIPDCDVQPAQTTPKDLDQEERKELSPGLSYLEQVCQMLEKVARQQMHSRSLLTEMNDPRQYQPAQRVNDCQPDYKAAGDGLSSCDELENADVVDVSSKTQKENVSTVHKRLEKSASDTTLHSKMFKEDCRGHCASTFDLTAEEDQEKQKVAEAEEPWKKNTFKEPIKVKKNKTTRTWKIKIPSRREAYNVADTVSQQSDSLEKNTTRRRLSQLFKRQKKIQPA